MGKTFSYLLVIIFILADPLCHAQTSFDVSEPRLNLLGNRLLISYDILDSAPEDKFSISIIITDEEGTTISASSFEGDVGENVSGGKNKHVSWNFEADNVFINAYLLIKISAKLTTTAEPLVVHPAEEERQEEEKKEPDSVKPVSGKESTTKDNVKEYGRTAIVLQSLVFPGLGLSRITGNPHWVKGVAGYGCIITSIVLNQRAVNTFNSIENLDDINDVSEAFDKSVKQDNLSEVLAYTAAAIWATDFIWTILGTSDLKKSPLIGQMKGISFRSNIDPLSGTPLIGISYLF